MVSWRVINSGAILYLDLFTHLQRWILLKPAKHQRLNCPMLDKKISISKEVFLKKKK